MFGDQSGYFSYQDNYVSIFSVFSLRSILKDLDPHTTYSFIVQPMNGCVAGEWSNTLAVGKKNGKYFKYGATQMIVPARALAAIARNYVTGKTSNSTGTTIKSENANNEKAGESEKPSTTQPTQATITTAPICPLQNQNLSKMASSIGSKDCSGKKNLRLTINQR